VGFFNFFRRKQRSAAAAGDLDEPRCHHYALAHYALRSVAHKRPLGFLGILASPDAKRFLADLLESVAEHCAARQPAGQGGPDFSVADLTVHKVRVGPYPCTIIEMPRPRATTEAYFVAAVLLARLDQEMPEPEQVKLRYFTLEKGFVLGGPPRTVLCEWTEEGAHVNYGVGPTPRLEALVQGTGEAALEGSVAAGSLAPMAAMGA
jgi:hypothetical protein